MPSLCGVGGLEKDIVDLAKDGTGEIDQILFLSLGRVTELNQAFFFFPPFFFFSP